MTKLFRVSWVLLCGSAFNFAAMTFIIVNSVLSDHVTREMTYAAVKDVQGNVLCATDEPNQVLTVRSKPMCFFRCQDELQCWAVNWKNQTQSCEIYSYNPKSYDVSNGCSFLIPVVQDCTPIKGLDGIYPVTISAKLRNVMVYCDLTTAGGGWLVFQRRVDGSVDFYRNWTSYQTGFGNISNEFWLGLDLLHALTSAKPHKLRIDLGDFDGNQRFAEYASVNVNSSADYYRLHVGDYTGTAGDCLTNPGSGSLDAQDMQFSTFDGQHHLSSGNCAQIFKGAWWYNNCHLGNLNGAYLRGKHASFANGVEWKTWMGFYYSLQFVEMKISAAI